MKEKTAFGINSIVSVVILLGIIIMVNLIAIKFFARMDLTENNMFSLTEFSRKTVANLDDKITIKAFFTSDLPAPYSSNARFVQDQLDEYKAYSKGNLQYEIINPGETEELEKEAQKYRIQPAQINVVENDEIQIKKVYMGLAILYEDKQEVIPLIQNTNGLEYDITSAILKISADEVKKVGFLTGHDEPDLYEGLGALQQRLSQLYQVVPVDLTQGAEVDAELTTLIIPGPKKPLTDWEKFAIDQFLMRGGKVALLLDPVETDITTSMAKKLDLGLDEWLATYGIKVNQDLLIDAQNRQITVSQRQGFFTINRMINYPFIPMIREFSPTNPIVKDLESIDLAFASTIDTTLSVEGLTFEPLFWSSPNSGVQKGSFNINPMQEMKIEDFSPGHFILGATISGIFPSYFAGKQVPDPAADDTTGTITSKPYTKDVMEQSFENRIVVIADADFIQDQLQTNPSNLVFFQNIVDWLTLDEGLIAIRSREITERPLAEISDAKKKFTKYANILGMPFIVLILGIIHWQTRRIRKKGALA